MHLNFIENCCYGPFYNSGCVRFWGYRLSLTGLSPSFSSPLLSLSLTRQTPVPSFLLPLLSWAHLWLAPPDLIETWSRCCLEIEKTEIRPYSPVTTALIISASADVAHSHTHVSTHRSWYAHKTVRITGWSVYFQLWLCLKYTQMFKHSSFNVCCALMFTQGQQASKLWKSWMKVQKKFR